MSFGRPGWRLVAQEYGISWSLVEPARLSGWAEAAKSAKVCKQNWAVLNYSIWTTIRAQRKLFLGLVLWWLRIISSAWNPAVDSRTSFCWQVSEMNELPKFPKTLQQWAWKNCFWFLGSSTQDMFDFCNDSKIFKAHSYNKWPQITSIRLPQGPNLPKEKSCLSVHACLRLKQHYSLSSSHGGWWPSSQRDFGAMKTKMKTDESQEIWLQVSSLEKKASITWKRGYKNLFYSSYAYYLWTPRIELVWARIWLAKAVVVGHSASLVFRQRCLRAT